MNKHTKEYLATQKRVEKGKEAVERRKKKSLESYRCYLAYMINRKKL